jgi:hypothetical protein
MVIKAGKPFLEGLHKARAVFGQERKVGPRTRSLPDGVTPEIPISYGQEHAPEGSHLICMIDRIADRGLMARTGQLKKGVKVKIRTDYQQ